MMIIMNNVGIKISCKREEEPMRYPVEETAEKHARILDEAARLFREKGFAEVSVGELMKSAVLTHGPFYNHFRSKEVLMAETIELSVRLAGEGLDKYGCDSEGKAKYIAAYLSPRHRDHAATGCPIAALSVDVGRDEQLKEPFTRTFKGVLEKMVHCWPWSSKRSARSESIRALSTMVGAVILARAIDDDSLSREILHEARQALI
jgi:TetR/AcrR family transcriptional regulator, transcriptional repressor for nem operon